MTDYVSEPANLYGANPELMGRIIAQMKSKGSFDQLRKEILADIDTKVFLSLLIILQNYYHQPNAAKHLKFPWSISCVIFGSQN
jgi:COMPASS (Complex proteins associated with Set1p) component shg1